MTKTKTPTLFAMPLVALALAGCGAVSQSASSSAYSEDDHPVSFVTPTGAPALAFYDQGNNASWVSSSDPTNVVLPAFGTNNYDAIVFDGITGLRVIQKNSYGYKFAQWVSGGNFYVVSVTHAAGDAFLSSYKIDAFVKTGNASQSFLKLASDRWGWTLDASADYPTGSVKWETGVASVLTNLTGNPTAFDYYVIAEPLLTSAKATLAKAGKTLNVIYNLQTEWTALTGEPTIPAAGLFVNSASYAIHKDVIDRFLSDTQTRQDKTVTDPTLVKSNLDAYGDDTKVSARFGFTSTLAASLQANGADKFGILKTGDVTDVASFANAYASALSGSSAVSFDASLFLS